MMIQPKRLAFIHDGPPVEYIGASPRIEGPAPLAACLSARIGANGQESLMVVSLNIKNEIIGLDEVFRGGLSSSNVYNSEIFRTVLLRGAAAFILAHNHPSGDPAPSAADLQMTRDIAQGAKLLGVALLDHIIVTDDAARFHSFRESGTIAF